MQEKFLTIKDLMKITGIKSEATIRKMVARRQLPSGILLGPRRVWFESTIMETLKAWKKTATDNFLSTSLVERLATREARRRFPRFRRPLPQERE